jgi:colanic acid biosynthesis glycosyl transferase WcaI
MGEKQGLESVVEAARILEGEKRIFFVLSGDGAARQRLEDSSAGLENMRFTALQPVSRLNDLLNLADIHILPQRPDVASLVMPSKLLGMLASGRPVVATAAADSELAGIVGMCGIVVPPGEAITMALALCTLAHDSEQRSRLGLAARALCVEEWDWGRVLADFEKQVMYLSGGRSHV